ncbi:UPF0547 protein C16orf87 homolog isoform X2 [Liolophura sinensis]|uniref:UPF0547 protein C16orf87 homolog isoform X2 n=1 Tax=Liolophura sinensis TaxID=3198878 RepID=UPI00315939A2
MRPARPRRKSDRMACKQCPACCDQVPVACKYCPCGHQFPTRNKAKQKSLREESSKDDTAESVASEPNTDSTSKDGSEIGTKRRTVRTKRFRPDFFNPMEEQVTRRKPKEGEKAKRRRSRAKSNSSTAKEETNKQATLPTPEDDMFANLPAEKALQYSVILAELNRKLTTQHFKPL